MVAPPPQGAPSPPAGPRGSLFSSPPPPLRRRSLPHFVGANTSVSVQRVWGTMGGADLGGGATLATHGDAE